MKQYLKPTMSVSAFVTKEPIAAINWSTSDSEGYSYDDTTGAKVKSLGLVNNESLYEVAAFSGSVPTL